MLYYLAIKTEILPFSPDLVVINVDMTDVVNDYVYRSTLETDNAGEPVRVRSSREVFGQTAVMMPQGVARPSALAELARRVVEYSVALRYLRNAMQRLGPRPAPAAEGNRNADTSANWLASEWTSAIESNVAFSMDVLGRTVKLLQSHGVKVMITGVPHHPQYAGQWSTKPHDVLARTAQQYGVPYLNSYEVLRRAIAGTEQARYYWDTDPTHFNIDGNAIWAEAMYTFLCDPANRLLPPRE